MMDHGGMSHSHGHDFSSHSHGHDMHMANHASHMSMHDHNTHMHNNHHPFGVSGGGGPHFVHQAGGIGTHLGPGQYNSRVGYRYDHPMYQAMQPYRKCLFFGGICILAVALCCIILGPVVLMTSFSSIQQEPEKGFGGGTAVGFGLFAAGGFLMMAGCLACNTGKSLMFMRQPVTQEITVDTQPTHASTSNAESGRAQPPPTYAELAK